MHFCGVVITYIIQTKNMNTTVGIIGLGNIGRALATNLVKGGRKVIIADKTFDKSKALAAELGPLAEPMEVSTAVREAGIVILAIYFDPIRSFLKEYAVALKGKLVIDPSNPIAPAEGGGFRKIIADDASAGAILAKELPEEVILAKTFGTLGAATLASSSFQLPRKVMFYALDDLRFASELETLISQSGFDPMSIGSLDKSIRIEVFGDLHEFGALGKTVTREEAQQYC